MKKTEFQMKVIYKVKELRENNNRSQAFLADLLELNSLGSIGNIESPKFKHKYTMRQLKIISEHFNYPFPLFFLTEEEYEGTKQKTIDLLINKMIKYVE